MTVTAFKVPGESAGAKVLTELAPPTAAAFVGESPIMTRAPAWKPVPAMLTGVPPADGPDVGLMPVTSKDAAPRMRRKIVPRPAVAACRRRSPQRAIGAEDEAGVHALAGGVLEALKGGEVAGGIHLEDRAVLRNAAARGRAVEVPVGQLDERGGRQDPLDVVEAVQRRDVARRVHLEDRAVTFRAAARCRTVESAVRDLDERREGRAAVGLIEAVQRRERSRRGDLEDGSDVAAAVADSSCRKRLPSAPRMSAA